ncbi:unnamed protein product, partial [Candidula unifasciata]
VGDMISVIDMPSAEDTIWWRGKRGFEVGFFPAECVEIIGDKIPTSMATLIPEPVATASASRRPSPLMKKHGKLLSFLRTFFSHRPPRNQLKQSGIVKERVFGCDLGEHLLNSGHDVPLLLKSCTDIIEEYGIVHGIYRLSGITSNIQKLRLAFDEDRVPDLTDDCYLQDIHSISSLLKMYFRELPNPLLTYQLYDKFADAVRDEENKLLKIHDVVQQLPPPHYRTTEYLMRHLARVAAFGPETEMHSKNLAIVWAPNLLRSKELEAGGGAAALQGVGIQAVVTECLICYCDIIFSDKMPDYNSQDSTRAPRKTRPKSLAISSPTRLLSLEEARERAFVGHMAPKKFIDVGGGPRNLPSKYHTVIDLPGYSKPASGNKKMSTTCGGGGGSGGWKSIFIKPRSGSIKKSRKYGPQDSMTLGAAQGKALTEEDVHNWKRHLRSAKSAESLFSLINSSHGSLSSRTSVDQTLVPEVSVFSQGHYKLQLSHKRSLSSDASAILHHCCSSPDPALHPQSPDKDTQSFKRGDSARKALHRRMPSAPSTPHEDRKLPRERVPSDELAASEDLCLSSSYSQHEGDMNIHAKINFRLLQVAEKSRSAKSQEELTSPLKRMAKCSPQDSKRAKGAGNILVGSRDDANKKMMDSCFHDYAEIVSDEDIINTPDSQGAISVSSSGCNMQDVLDQIDTRLALNAKLFPRQGIGDTSGYRVGDSPLSIVETSSLPSDKQTIFSPGTGLTAGVLTTPVQASVSAGSLYPSQSPTGVAVCPEDLTIIGSLREFNKLPEGFQSWPVDDSNQQQISMRAQVRPESGKIRAAADKATCGTATSTLVARRHTEFIPSLTAAARDLHNLHELLNSLTGEDSQLDVQTRQPVLPQNHKSSRNSFVQTLHDPTAGKVTKQKPSIAADSFEPRVEAGKAEGHVAFTSVGVGSGGMSKCLSVPSDIARSLENVTESQSDLLSSVTISELSASINSFSNGLPQEPAFVFNEAKASADSADRRHRRSTSLDSLPENDHLMTRTLREINSQMEAAFQHNKISSSRCSLDSLSHQQRLAVSDLELTSTAFGHHQGTIATTTDVSHRESSENYVHSSPGSIITCSSSDRLQSSADKSGLFDTDAGVPSQKLLAEVTLNSQTKEFNSEAGDWVALPSLPLNIVGKQAICDVLPASCSPSQLSPSDGLQLFGVRQQEDFDCLEKSCDQQCRLREKQTHKQSDELIVIETAHVVKHKPPELGAASSSSQHRVHSQIGNSSDIKHQPALQVSLTASDSTYYQVVRRQHSPRVEQKSSRFHLNVDGTRSNIEDTEDSVIASGRWKPLFTSDSAVDDTETCERMSSLCAAGLMSQRVRLSRDSSVSSLQSPDTSSPCILSVSAQSPLATPVREALPDLIQSTALTEAANADNRRCSQPLQLVLYHPDEFSVDIATSISSHSPNSRCAPLYTSPFVPQVHSVSQTVVVTKSTLTKSSTNNSLSEVIMTDRTISGRPPVTGGLDMREEQAGSLHLMLGGADVSRTPTLFQPPWYNYTDARDISEENRHNIQACRSEGSTSFNHDHIADSSHIRSRVTDSVEMALAVEKMQSSCTHEQHTLGPGPSPSLDTEAKLFFLHNSDLGINKEEAQNVVNQGREILMSPEIDKSGHRERTYPSLQSPSTVPVRRTSFSKIPRPKQNCDLASPRSTSNGGKRTEFLYPSSIHVDTSPSSSSSSASSSSRAGHTRRASEASSCGSTTKRQGHIRRSSDTKLTDLQTVSPVARGHSSTKPDFSGTGPAVTSPRNRGTDQKMNSTDVGGKTSRIPLSHRLPSPQSNRGKDASSLGILKQISKIPSPVPKPRKLNLSPKGNHAAVSAEGNNTVRACPTDISGRVAGSKVSIVRRDAESTTKKAVIVKDMPSRSEAQLVIESQADMSHVQTVHATKVSQPARQVAGSNPATESVLTSFPLANETSILTVTSGEIARSQSHLQAEVKTVGGDKKTPPPVAARKFTYDSRSLPRRSTFLETQMSFPGDQSSWQLYTDMLGSRSSLDDSVLQLAAERHDLFVPGVREDGSCYAHCLGSLRVKRSQKMQSLMDLFEHRSDSVASDSSGTHSPGTQHRVRTCSASVTAQGGQLTPCVEAVLCDSTLDDDTFLPPASEGDDTLSSDCITGPGHENSKSGGCTEAPEKYTAVLCSSVTLSKGEDVAHGSSAEQRSVNVKPIAETQQPSLSSNFDQASFSTISKPPYHHQLPETRTRSNSSSDGSAIHQTNVWTSRPSSFSGIDVQLQTCGYAHLADTHPHLADTHAHLADTHAHLADTHPHLADTHPHLADKHQPSVFDRQHSSLVFINPAPRHMVRQLFESEVAHDAENELCTTVGNSAINTAAPSPRMHTERRNSIKELKQLFERADTEGNTTADSGLINADGQSVSVRPRVRSVSPQTDHEHVVRTDRPLRHSLEISSSSVIHQSCQSEQISSSVTGHSSQSELKAQPLRLGPKPFYGAHK